MQTALTTETEALKKQLTTETEALKKQLTTEKDNMQKKLTNEKKELEKQLTERTEKLQKAEASIGSANARIAELKSEVAAAKKREERAQKDLNALKAIREVLDGLNK